MLVIAFVVTIPPVNQRVAKFVREFKESSRSSRRTDGLFAIALTFFLPISFSRTPIWLFTICLPSGILFFIAAVVSLALDNRRARKLAEGPRVKPGICHVCGYNLTGNTSGVCPERGTSVPKAPADKSPRPA